MLYLETNLKQQKLNIYSSITFEIDLFTQLRRYPGIVKIFLHKKCDIELEYDNNSSVHGFLWIVSLALEAITRFQYLGIDATFEIAKQYVLSCPQIIVNGLSLLLWFNVGPKENWTIFNSFYKELLKLISSKVPLLNLPVLSDQGPFIHKFCNLNGILQYFCIRHIISDVGASPFLG